MPGNVPHPEAVLRGHRGEVQALDFDGSERFLVSGDSLGEVRVWRLGDLRPAAIRRMHPLNAGILSLRLFQSSGSQLLCTQGRDGTTLLWVCDRDLQPSQEPVRSFVRDCYSFCRCSVLAGAACARSEDAQQQSPRHHENDIGEAFAAAVLAGDGPATAPVEAAAAGETEGTDGARQQESDATSQTGAGAAEASIGAAAGPAIWALHPCSQASEQQPPALLAIPGANERTAEVVCCACGQQLAEFPEEAAGRKLGMLMAVQLYCPALPSPGAAAGEGPGSAASLPGRICLAAGYEDGSVAVWPLGGPAGGPPLMQRQLCREPVMALALDAGGAGGAAGSAEEQVVVFRLDHVRGRISERYGIELDRKQGIGDVAVRPDSKLLTTAGWDGRVRVYKYRSGRPLAVLKYHTSAVTGLQFAPRSMLLATAARDGTVALWPLFQPDAPA